MERRCMGSTKSDQYVPSELCLVEGTLLRSLLHRASN